MKRFLLFVFITVSPLNLLSMQVDTTPLLNQHDEYLEALKNKDLACIKKLLRKEQDAHPTYESLSCLGIACECLNTNIKKLNTYLKESPTSWWCCCATRYPQKLAQNITLFKKIIVILEQHYVTLSDQISIELTLQLLTGQDEDKELSKLLTCYLRTENDDQSYQRSIS